MRAKSVGHRVIARRVLVVFASIVAALALFVPAAIAAPAGGYIFRSEDRFEHWDGSGQVVHLNGSVRWFVEDTNWNPAPVLRGEYTGTVQTARAACMWVKVDWRDANGTASWPPSAGATTTSDGWYRTCPIPGYALDLKGIVYSSRRLLGSTICIAYSPYSDPDRRLYQTCESSYY